MRVILRSDIKGVGKPGDVKDVAEGYATNFLLPRGLAVKATAEALEAVKRQKDSVQARTTREKAEMADLAKRLGEVRLSFALKAGAQGKVFGSVTNRDIAEALASKGFEIDRARIHLPEPLRSLGEHRIELRLLPDVHATVVVEIVPA